MDDLSSSNPSILSIVIHVLFLIALLLNPVPVNAEKAFDPAINPDEDIDAELKYLQEETYVITGSRIPQLIEKSAYSIHVVTDKEIRQMGAIFLTDVIPIIPGWFVDWRVDGGRITARGHGGFQSGEILIMINSHTINEGWTGGTRRQYKLLSIDNAKRIEFLSGPGSAVYGSGAFGGVINIITKEAEDVDGLEAKIIAGSYDTQQTNFLFGKSYKSLEITGNLNFYETDGFDGKIKEDQQTWIDERSPMDASLAPGRMNGDVEKWDGHINIKYKGFTFDGKYTDSHNEYLLEWQILALSDNDSHSDNKNYYMTFSHEAYPLEGFHLQTNVYRNHYEFSSFFQTRPEGFFVTTPDGFVVLEEPLLTKAYYKTNRTGIESQFTYEITDAHTMVAGVLYEKISFYDSNAKGNYIPNPTISENVILLPDLQDLPGENIADNTDRNIKAVFWEDVWDIRDDLRFNVGCRYDDYSDFGDAVSPRVGINWQIKENFQARMHYGRAFRAPSLEERNSTLWGSTDLDAVIIDTYELGFYARLFPSFSGEIGYIYSDAKDYIAIEPESGKFINHEEFRAKSVELKMKYDLGRGSYLGASYAYVELESKDTGETSMLIPAHMGSIMTNIRLNRYLNWNAHGLYRGGWHRWKGDPRNDISDYVVVNTTLIARKFLKGFDGLEFSVSINNLFNEDYSSPYEPDGYLPDDIPMPGRNYLFELRYVY